MTPPPLRVALLSYRSKPHCGGQGVYVRHLSRELTRLGHTVEVISGQPYPRLDDGVRLTPLPSLDLYREPDPFRTPRPGEFRGPVDVLEWLLMCSAAFPEPLTFSLRAWAHLRARRGEFDLVHDNQGLGYGLLGLPALGLPVLATVHHPLTVDRRVELAAASGRRRRLAVRRWYSFARMQASVARRLPALTTVSASARADIERDFRVPAGRVRVIPVGVEADVFRPPGDVATGGGQAGRVAGRLVVTTSADVPLKGLVPLLEAVAKLATERQVELVVVGTARPGGAAQKAIDRLALRGTVRFVSGLTDDGLADLLRSASVAVVPSLYEGFSLPAVEAMACATPLVATTAGALPEVVGPDGEAALHVPPGDPERMAAAIGRVLDDPGLGERLGAAGRERVLRRYTWRATAAATADWYAEVLGRRAGRSPGAGAASAGRRSGGC